VTASTGSELRNGAIRAVVGLAGSVVFAFLDDPYVSLTFGIISLLGVALLILVCVARGEQPDTRPVPSYTRRRAS